MKLTTTVKSLVSAPARMLTGRYRDVEHAGESSYWLAGEQHPGQASDFESWPPRAQDDPPSPAKHQPKPTSRSAGPPPNA